MAPFIPTSLTRSTPIYQIFGANTNIGKTIISTTLCAAVRARKSPIRDRVLFLKPVSTGPLEESDDIHINRYTSSITTKCLYRFNEPVSPHLAARGRYVPSDSEICTTISTALHDWAGSGPGLALVETAGGVLSPGPNGSLQADLYRPLRLPVILVADSRLGGISSTISAYESLSVRGYDVEAIVSFKDEYYQGHEFLGEFAQQKKIPILAIPKPPLLPSSSSSKPDEVAAARAADEKAMSEFYTAVASNPQVTDLVTLLEARHVQRIERLESMAQKAHEVIWYPFTQHHSMTARDISVIDSAHNDCFQTLKPTIPSSTTTTTTTHESENEKNSSLLQPSFDGSASWWTQGLGHGNPELSLQSAYAAGRYGHVMFAGTIHEPALSLSELLLKAGQNPRLKKVFFTDNGSTGMEVAVKMALRAASVRYNWSPGNDDVGILGLSGSYHGDTMGAMDCSEPSTYNKKVEWYRGRGYWFDFPRVKMAKGVWTVGIPQDLRKDLGEDVDFPSLSAIFNLDARKDSDLGRRYEEYIKATIEDLVVRQGKKFGALMLEPIILGAGGMLFSDPLFQQILVQTVRLNPQLFSPNASPRPTETETDWSGLPVIFDEVFTGLYRLGRLTTSSFLKVHPDIIVNGKLLTGGLLPICTTMASNEIFQVFDSPEKSQALLHGHSYTGNPVGCSVAEYSVRTMLGMEKSGYWQGFAADWKQSGQQGSEGEAQQGEKRDPEIWSCWSQDLVKGLSSAETVESVFALGSVLSITLRDRHGGGYTSTAAAGLQQELKVGDAGYNVHSRVLGNVLYVMASLTSKPASLENVERLLRKNLL